MSDRTGIEWTEATWNPTTGCDRVSPGCDNCYALVLARRLKAMGNSKYQRDGDPRSSGPGFGLTVHEESLELPHRWRKPRQIFVNSMSDLFHPSVPTEFIQRVFAVMADTPRHTYQVLTKRSHRLMTLADQLPWPSNVWMGVSVESERYSFRVRHLRSIQASVRFVSAEPLLGSLASVDLAGIDWLIVGGESGRSARPMDPEWVFELRDKCLQDNIPFFFKQWGEWMPADLGGMAASVDTGARHSEDPAAVPTPGAPMLKVGKGAAGRRLDGATWDQMPSVLPNRT